MGDTPYFPPLYGKVDCSQCEIASKCRCCGKYQRDRRDFTCTSGRCPRLPDHRGFVDDEQQKLYADTFPLVHAELGCEKLHLTLTVPGWKRLRKIYLTPSGYWYFREKDASGAYVRRVVSIDGCSSREEIICKMELYSTDYCQFRAAIEDYCV